MSDSLGVNGTSIPNGRHGSSAPSAASSPSPQESIQPTSPTDHSPAEKRPLTREELARALRRVQQVVHRQAAWDALGGSRSRSPMSILGNSNKAGAARSGGPLTANSPLGPQGIFGYGSRGGG